MRSISTLFFLVIVSCCFAQTVDTSKVVIINCWGMAKTDTTKKLPEVVSAAKARGLNVQSVSQGVFGCRMVCRGFRTIFPTDTLPLLLVDWDIKKYDTLKLIKPDTIQEIRILKPAASTAIFGPDGVYGAIIVTTKKFRLRTFTIKDFINGKPLPGATVSFISANKKDTLFFAANDSGIVTTSKLTPSAEYSIKVSSVGYKTLQQIFINTSSKYPKEILLAKDIKVCEEAMLSVISHRREFSCGGTRKRTTILWKAGEKGTDILKVKIKTYPNPVSKGATFTIQWKEIEEAVAELRLVSLDGKTMLRHSITNKGFAGQLQLSTDPRWASGIYFLQMICEKGRVLASEKIIIQ